MSGETPSFPGEGETREVARLQVGVSSCLLGRKVRFDGGHKRNEFLLNSLGPHVRWHSVCPEAEIGLGIPRPTIRLEGDSLAPRLVEPKGDQDLTESMLRFAGDRCANFPELDGFVLKKDSPSCGAFRVRVYDKGQASRNGRGLFAGELMRRLPWLPVEEEGRLNDARLRENFVERLFVMQRWRMGVGAVGRPRDLVAFHSAHKFAIMAHSVECYRRLGRMVAGAGGVNEFGALCDAYRSELMRGLSRIATVKRHVNVLQHIMGFLKAHLCAHDKAELVEAIEAYRSGIAPFVVPLVLLRHHLRRNEVAPWILEQTYLQPYPPELKLRNQL